MLKIATYGNCQAESLQFILKSFPKKFDVVPLRPIHLLDRSCLNDVLSKIRDVDYFLYQPVSSSYGELASNNLISHLGRSATAISFPSIYFDAYQPRQIYLRDPGSARINSPIGDYHDGYIIDLFLRGASRESAAAALNDVFLSESDCIENLSRSLGYFSAREGGLDIKLSRFINNNYFSRRLFYSFNHPANCILNEVFLSFIEIIGLGSSVDFSQINNIGRDFLSNYYFKSDSSDPLLFEFDGFSEYRSNQLTYSTNEVIDLYFSEYEKHGRDRLEVAYDYSIRRRNQVLSNKLVE